MRFITQCRIYIEILTDNGERAGTMTGEFYGDTVRIEVMKLRTEHLSANLLGLSFAEMVDAALARGAKRITWDYSEPSGKDYSDKKNDPYYLAILPLMILHPELEMTRQLTGGEYYADFSEFPPNLWHEKRYTPERVSALGIKFMPVEKLPEYWDQFEEMIRSDEAAYNLSPLGREYVPEISCIMVINGELAGWCLSREITEDIARISPVYAAKKFRAIRAGTIMEVHVMNILKKKYSGIRFIYDREQDAHLIRFYSFYLGKAFTETARIFSIAIKMK